MVTPEESAALLERIRYSEDKACFEGRIWLWKRFWKSSMSSMLFLGRDFGTGSGGRDLGGNTSGLSITAIAEVVKDRNDSAACTGSIRRT